MSERTFTTSYTIRRSPWDVYEFFADEGQQRQWRDQHAGSQSLVSAEPYTRVEYADRTILEFEPDGSDTLVTITKTYVPTNKVSKALGFMRRAKNYEEDLRLNLIRAENALVYDSI